eukprot:s2193_g3.t1
MPRLAERSVHPEGSSKANAGHQGVGRQGCQAAKGSRSDRASAGPEKTTGVLRTSRPEWIGSADPLGFSTASPARMQRIENQSDAMGAMCFPTRMTGIPCHWQISLESNVGDPAQVLVNPVRVWSGPTFG